MMGMYQHIPVDGVEIILVNDASTDVECDSGVAWWQKHMKYHTIRYKKNKENLGFGGSNNVGAAMAKGDIIVFLNNDVLIRGNFLTQVIALIEQHKGKVFIGNEIIRYRAGWNEFKVQGHEIVIPYANGWIMACTKELWNSLQGFDPIYGKYDFEDVDISTQVLELGYALDGLHSKLILHMGGITIASLGTDRMSQTKRNKELYFTKWKSKLLEINEKLRG